VSRRFRKGDLIEVKWSDPTGTVNEGTTAAHLAPCITRGTVESRHGKELVLWHSRYTDKTGDRTTLNTGCIDDWRVLADRETLKQKGTT